MSIETSTSVKALAAAMLQFQGLTSGVKRDAKNPHFKTNYASLEAVIDYARPALQQAGLVFTQAPGAMVDGALEVTTRITHAESGEWQQATMHIPLAKRDPQGAGSALTYAQRYSLMAALGLPPTDDDGEAAIDRSNERPATTATPRNNQGDDLQKAAADALIGSLEYARTLADLEAWKADEKRHIDSLNDFQFSRFKKAYAERRKELATRFPANTLEAG